MTSISFWCFFELIKKETLAFFKNFSNDFIDCVIATTTWVGVFAYLMKGTGINESYGFFILIGSFAGNGLYISAGYCFILAQKINNKQISNYLNLPVNSFFYFISFSISTAIKVFIMEISILPIGKLLLWNKFNLANFCFIKFILISIITSIFYGFFSLWLSSFVKDLENSGWVWTRVISPIYMFCGYFSTWESVFQTNNIIIQQSH